LPKLQNLNKVTIGSNMSKHIHQELYPSKGSLATQIWDPFHKLSPNLIGGSHLSHWVCHPNHHRWSGNVWLFREKWVLLKWRRQFTWSGH